MAFIGGDIIEMTYNHPTLGSGKLFPKSKEDGTLDPGGFRSEDDASMITANGTLITQLNRVAASLETPPIAQDSLGDDQLAAIADMAGSPVDADWTVTHISGAIYGAKGRPVGDLSYSTNAGTFSFKLAFNGKLVVIN